MSEAKACPFCGHEAEKCEGEYLGFDYPLYGCVNPDCPCIEMPFVRLEEWDDRPIEDELNARIAKLEATLAEALPYEVTEKLRKGEGTYTPMPELPETFPPVMGAGDPLG